MLPVTETVLENGLTVLIREERAAPVVSVWAGYRVGARNERPGVTGASHWVEHMTFKGTARLETGELFRNVARNGGVNNGFTTDDFTCYYETLPASQLEVGLLIEAERMASVRFDPEETERERTVILAERDGSENNPHFTLSEQMGEAVFRTHPYRWPVIGYREDLQRITRDELRAHYETHYAPGNAVLVVAGDVDPAATVDRIRALFGEIPARPAPPGVEIEEPPQRGERRVEVRRPGALPYLSVAYRAPAYGHPDWHPLALLDALLSGAKPLGGGGGGYMGRTARLYRALVETRLALNAGSSVRRSVDPYVFSASLTLREEVEREAAEEALLACVEGLAADPPGAEELERVLRQAEAQYAYGREGVTGGAMALGLSQLTGSWSDLERHVERLRAVRRDDLARVAATYLRPENRTVGWYIPEGEAPAPRAAGAPSAAAPDRAPAASRSRLFHVSSSVADQRLGRLEPRREALGNGLVLLCNRTPDARTVAIRGVIPAGSARETAEHAGLASFVARLLRRGTAARSAQEIAGVVEEIGASFNVWAGVEAMGFSARCLERDLEVVLDLLQDVLENPAFEETEVERGRGEIYAALRQYEDSTRVRAEEAVLRMLYPADHPYARFNIGERETVARIGREELRAFHREWYRPSGACVSVAGAADPDLVRSRLERWFAGRDAGAPQPELPVAPSPQAGRASIHMPHKSQVDIIMASPGVPRLHPDFYPLWLVNVILGGFGLMGRLGERVREQRGIAYHVSCSANSRRWAGEWLANAGVAPENVDVAIEDILDEVRRIRREPVTEEELEDARSYLIGSAPLRLETNDGVAGYLLTVETYGLGLDHIYRTPELIRAQTREGLREAAERYMDPERISIAVAGPVEAHSS